MMELVIFFVYNLLFHLFGIAAIPVLLWKISKYKHSLKQKLGFIPPNTLNNCTGTPRIWVNAVSVGEVVAVNPVVKAIREQYPYSSIIISTGTETGQRMAHQLMREDVQSFIYFPLDTPLVVKKMLKIVSPQVFVTAETEIWPNFLRYAKKMGVKTMLVNGRISVRSVGKYYRARFFFRRVLSCFDCLGMASELDSDRIKMIGAPHERVFVTGNSKFDALIEQTNHSYEEEMRKALNIGSGEDVFIAASTHSGEEEVIIDAYRELIKEFPGLILIIVPRHTDRTSALKKLLIRAGFNSCYIRNGKANNHSTTSSGKYSEKEHGSEHIIIVNTTGELSKLYSVGTIVFCGGSLVPRGGQNILEPAAWGKVVTYGPSMEDFLEAKELLNSAGAGFTVRNAGEIVSISRRFLSNPKERKIRGEAGRKAILARTGAAKKSIQLLSKLIAQDEIPHYPL